MENVQRLSRKRVHQKRMLMETGKSSNMKLKFTKEELEKLYIEEELSTRDIAKQLNISQTTVRRYLAKYNIETRKGEDAKCTSVMIRNYRYFDNKTQANQIDNLVCLCNKCHSFVHSKQNVNKIYIDDKI